MQLANQLELCLHKQTQIVASAACRVGSQEFHSWIVSLPLVSLLFIVIPTPVLNFLNFIYILFVYFLLNQARAKAARAWFLEIVLVRVSVCVRACVCVSAPEAINNQWRDMV